MDIETRAKEIVAEVVEAFADPKLCHSGHVRLEFGQADGEWLWSIVVTAATTAKRHRILRQAFYSADKTLEGAHQDLLRQIARWKDPGAHLRQESRAEALRLVEELHAKGEVSDKVLAKARKELT